MASLDSAKALNDPTRVQDSCRDAHRTYDAVVSYLNMFAIDHPDRQRISASLQALKTKLEAVAERLDKTP